MSRGRGRSAAAGLGALLILLALIAGLPVLLYRLGGSPLPGHVPAAAQVGRALLHRDSASIVLAAVRDVSWLAWALFTLAVLAEVQAVLRRRTAPRLWLGGMQTAAARLVALAALTFTAAPVGTLLVTPQPVSTVLQADVTAMPTARFTVGTRLLPAAPPPGPAAAAAPAAPAIPAAAPAVATPPWAPATGRPETQPGPVLPPPARPPAAPGASSWTGWTADDGGWDTGPAAWAGPRGETAAAASDPAASTMAGSDAAAADTAAASASARTASEEGMGIIQLVTVRPGDCLWTIAQQHLGSGDRYHEIVALNLGHDMGNGQVFTNPSVIRPGWVLRVPAGPPVAQPGGGTPAPGAGGGTHPGHAASSPPFSSPHQPASAPPSATPSAQPSARVTAPTAPAGAASSAAASAPAVPPDGTTPAAPGGGPPSPGVQAGRVTPVSSVASVSPAQDSRLPLGLAFGTGVLAGGAAASLARLRHRQRQARRRGRRIPVPASAPVAAAEQRLNVAAAQEPVTALRGVLSHLAAALVATPQQMPEITALLVRPDSLEVLLASPAAEPPPPPFTVPGGRQGTAWQLWLDGDLPGLADGVGDLLPGLLTIGACDGGYLLADLEQLQVTTVEGPASMTAAVLRSAAAELVTGQLAGWYDLILVGFPELAALGGRGSCCDSLDAGLDLLTAKAVALRRRLGESPAADVRYHRLDDPADEDWALTLLVSSVPPTPGQLALLSDLSAEPGGIAALVPAGPEPASGRRLPATISLSAEPAGRDAIIARLWPLQLEARPQILDDADYEALTSLFVTATETHDLSPADPPYDRWLWPPDLAGGGGPAGHGPAGDDLATGIAEFDGPAHEDDDDPGGDDGYLGGDESYLGGDDGYLGGHDGYLGGDGSYLGGDAEDSPAASAEPDGPGSDPRLIAVPRGPDESYLRDLGPAVPDGWAGEDDWSAGPVLVGDHWPAPNWAGDPNWAAGWEEGAGLDDAADWDEVAGLDAPAGSSEAGEPAAEPGWPDGADAEDQPGWAEDPAVTGLPGAPAAWLSDPTPAQPDQASEPPRRPAGEVRPEPSPAPDPLEPLEAPDPPESPEPAAPAAVPDGAGPPGAAPAAVEASLRIGVLGTFTINGQPGALLPAQSQLVLALALNGTSGLSNQQLCYLLGADPDRPKPSDSLRQLIVRTRRQLGRAPDRREWIEHLGGGQYALHPAARFDWHEFDALATEGMRSRDAQRLRRALGLIRGRPFTGCYYWWLDLALTETVRAQIVDAADVLAALELTGGDPAAAARAARIGLAGDAGAEQLWRALMRAEHAAGNLSGVREAWSRCLDAISEIAPDGEPHPGTAAVYRELLGDVPARPAWAGG